MFGFFRKQIAKFNKVKVSKRMVGKNGIKFMGNVYGLNRRELSKYYNKAVLIYYDPRNLSSISVYDPNEMQTICIAKKNDILEIKIGEPNETQIACGVMEAQAGMHRPQGWFNSGDADRSVVG